MAVASDTTRAFEAPAPLPAFSAADKATLDGTVKWTGKELLGLRNGCAQEENYHVLESTWADCI